MIRRSAPRPVIAPPTPASKYSPPCAVSPRPAQEARRGEAAARRGRERAARVPARPACWGGGQVPVHCT